MGTRYFLSPSGVLTPAVTIPAEKDEVYLFESDTKATDTPKITVDAARLVDIAATVYSEAWKEDPREGEAITRIIRNRAEYTLHADIQSVLSAANFWVKVREKDFKGRGGSKYKATSQLPIPAWLQGDTNAQLKTGNGVYPEEMVSQFKNVIRGLVSEKDITFASYFFDETAGLAATTHTWRQTKNASDLFPPGWVGATVGGLDPACSTSPTQRPGFCGNVLTSGTTEYQPEFIQTCVYGKTTFFKKNPIGGIYDKKGRMVNSQERAFP